MSRLIWVVACLGVLGGCNGSKQKETEMSPKSSDLSQEDRSRCDVKGKRVVPLDLNKDEQPDVWKIYAQKEEGGATVDVLTCKEQDLNFDGRKDVWVYYDDQGNRQMEEMDLDFDGKVDLVTIRRGGKVIRQEMDTNYDGRADIWNYFEEEVLVRVERDSNNDGKVDYWEFYEGGNLDRVGYDKNGDGQPDDFDRAPAQASAAPPEPQETATPAEGGAEDSAAQPAPEGAE